MRPEVVRYVLYGQICFYVGLLLCIIIRPDGLAANGGVSFYGVYKDTILPYTLSLLGPAFFSIRAFELVTDERLRIVRRSLVLIGVFAVGVLLTPDAAGNTMDNLHRTFGALLFITQLVLSGWFLVRLKFDRGACLLALLELASGIAAFHYLAPPKGLLLQAQVLYQTAFAALFIYACRDSGAHLSDRP